MDKLARMKMHKLLLLAMACTWAMGATAQWQWVDKDGRKVFSDRPPPQEIPEKDILKQPSGSRTPSPPALSEATPPTDGAQATTTASKTATSAVGSGKDKALEDKKAQAEAAEAAKKKADEDKQAKAQADNCVRAREAKATFNSGKPITRANAQGERIFLDEAGRAAESKRIDGIIAADCKR